MSRTSPHDRPAETARLPRVARELGVPAETIEELSRAGAGTVGELRAAGGSGRMLEATGDPDLRERLRLLDAHAALSVLPVGEATVTRLRDAGMRSVLDVAAGGEERIRMALGPTAADDEVAAIRGAADAQAAVLTAAAAGARVSADRGALARSMSALLSGTCERDECLSALSPLAYLADLLDFAVRHLRQPVMAPGLEGRYSADPSGSQPVLTRVDAAIDFDWGAAAPAPGLPVDGFAVTWSGWCGRRPTSCSRSAWRRTTRPTSPSGWTGRWSSTRGRPPPSRAGARSGCRRAAPPRCGSTTRTGRGPPGSACSGRAPPSPSRWSRPPGSATGPRRRR